MIGRLRTNIKPQSEPWKKLKIGLRPSYRGVLPVAQEGKIEMGTKISLGDVAWAASLAKDKRRLLAMPLRHLTESQAFSWPLCGIVEREPNASARWKMTDFGMAVRSHIEKEVSRGR